MRRYRFRLERLLGIRRYRELEWELKLAVATGECVRLEGDIQEMTRRRRETLAHRYDDGGLDMNYLLAAELYLRRVDLRTHDDREALSEKERERDEIRDGYLAASRERKVLERLKERRTTADRHDQEVNEIGRVDDMSSSVATWRTKHG